MSGKGDDISVNHKPAVSVVIPTYNRSSLLARAISSAAMQSHRAFEVIVIDDNSNDNTNDVVERMSARAAGLGILVRYIRLPKRCGGNHARNVGIEASDAKYVAFLDSDDLWHPRKLEFQLAAIQSDLDQPILCFTDRYRVNQHYKIIAHQSVPKISNPLRSLRRGNRIGTLSTVLISRQVLRAMGGFDRNLHACQDWDLYLKAASCCKFVHVASPLTIYYDGMVERVSNNARMRAHAHLRIYQRHLRGNLAFRQLSELLRNLTEDFTRCSRPIWARRMYAHHLWSKRQKVRAALTCLRFRAVPDVLGNRYKSYAINPIANPQLHGSQKPILEEYHDLFAAIGIFDLNVI